MDQMTGGIAPQQPPEDVVSDEEEGGNVGPEEQSAYDEFVLHGYELLYDGGEVNSGILAMLDDEPSDLMAVLKNIGEVDFTPIVALAATATVVVLEVVRRYGEELPDPSVIFKGGQELLENIAEIAGKYGSHDYSEDEVSEAFRMGADLYREAGKDMGLVDMDALKAEFDEIVQADKEGRAAEVLPGIDRGPKQPEEEEDVVRG